MEPPRPHALSARNVWPVSLPFALQLVILLGCILGGALLGSLLLFALGQWGDFDLSVLLDTFGEHSDKRARRMMRAAILLNHLCTFVLPALATAWLLFRKKWARCLRLDAGPELRVAGWGVLFILASFPLAQALYWLNHQIPLAEWMVQLEDSTNEMIKALLVMETPEELFVNVVIIALVPAVGEELVFRGLLQQMLHRALGRGVLAVWLSALVFSAFHMQFEGFLPRLALGAVLGYLFYWSRNLWVPVLAHFANNAVQVVAAYYFRDLVVEMEPDSMEPFTWPSALASLVLVLLIGYHIHQLTMTGSADKSAAE